MTADYLQQLREFLEKGELLFIVGAGLASIAGLPDWLKVARSLDCGNDIPKEDNFVAVGHLLRCFEQFDDRQALIERIQKMFGAIQPSECHRLLAQVASRYRVPIIVAYYDDLIEQSLRTIGTRYDLVLDRSDIPFTNPNSVEIFYIMGRLQSPDTMIVTQSDFDGYQEGHPRQTEHLRAYLENKTVLLIGISWYDPFLRIFDPMWGGIEHQFRNLRRQGYSVGSSPKLKDVHSIPIDLSSDRDDTQSLERWLRGLLSEKEKPRWLPEFFNVPPFSAKNAEEDHYLERYFLSTTDFERIRDPANGTMLIFGESGSGKSSIFRMLGGPAKPQNVVSISVNKFDGLRSRGCLNDSVKNLRVQILRLLENRVAQQLPDSDEQGMELAEDLKQRFDDVKEQLGIQYVYVLLDRLDVYAPSIDVGVDFVLAILQDFLLLDNAQFKIFLPTSYRERLRQSNPRMLERFNEIIIKWPDKQLDELLRERINKTTGHFSSFNDLLEPSRPQRAVLADRLIVRYAYGSPRDLVTLADRVIWLHMHEEDNAANALISPGVFKRAVREFAEEKIRHYGEWVERVQHLQMYPLSFEEAHRIFGGDSGIQKAQEIGLIREKRRPDSAQRLFEIPDPRVRLFCPSCGDDQRVLE